MKKNGEVSDFGGYSIVRISSLNLDEDELMELKKWSAGQTFPLVEEDREPFGWIYEHDLIHFSKYYSTLKKKGRGT